MSYRAPSKSLAYFPGPPCRPGSSGSLKRSKTPQDGLGGVTIAGMGLRRAGGHAALQGDGKSSVVRLAIEPLISASKRFSLIPLDFFEKLSQLLIVTEIEVKAASEVTPEKVVRGRRRVWPLLTMAVGEWFEAPGDKFGSLSTLVSGMRRGGKDFEVNRTTKGTTVVRRTK